MTLRPHSARLNANIPIHFSLPKRIMSSLHLNAIDPAELMPLPELPESYGPRDDEELRIYNMVKEALDGGPGKTYASVADFIAELSASIPQTRA